jgi:hypothetical protein
MLMSDQVFVEPNKLLPTDPFVGTWKLDMEESKLSGNNVKGNVKKSASNGRYDSYCSFLRENGEKLNEGGSEHR